MCVTAHVFIAEFIGQQTGTTAGAAPAMAPTTQRAAMTLDAQQ